MIPDTMTGVMKILSSSRYVQGVSYLSEQSVLIPVASAEVAVQLSLKKSLPDSQKRDQEVLRVSRDSQIPKSALQCGAQPFRV